MTSITFRPPPLVAVTVERARGDRLELWVGALISDKRSFDGEIKAREDAMETLKQQKKKEDKEHEYQV